MDAVLKYLETNQKKALDDLTEFCKIPSVAARHEGIEEAAEFLSRMMDSAGLEVTVHKTSGSPVVTAEKDAGCERTLLFYDHYDVQPAEPFDPWESSPFEPEIRDGRIYGRGPADNKGDTTSRVWTVKAFKETRTELPVNIKFCVEGEEEIGSPHLGEYVNENTDFITADGGIWEFGGEAFDGVQEAWLGLKGDFYVQLEVDYLTRNVHSSLACILPSAPHQLAWALASMKDSDHRILIDGFYEGIKPLTDAEWEVIDKVDLQEELMKKHYGVDMFLNAMSGRKLKEAYYNAPTCTICGLTSGYQGEGSMTVLPAQASAKVDFRLVEGMDPDDILKKIRSHLNLKGFSDVKIAWCQAYPAAKTPVDHPFVKVVAEANAKVFEEPLRIHPTSPGSGPLYLFNDYVPMVSIGCSDFDSKGHSPNESIKLDNFLNAQKRIAYLMDIMGKGE